MSSPSHTIQESQICTDLRSFLQDEVLTSGIQLDDDAVLADVGVDSFALMEILLFVERQYGRVLPIERLGAESVRTVRTLGQCIKAWLNEADA